MKILYSSADLNNKIHEIWASPRPDEERVILVAFVGATAENYLPDPDGLEIICWLKPRSTDAKALHKLEQRGAKTFKSDNLQMEVCWSSKRGCVIGFANASQSALGRGGLKEAGVWFPASVVDINSLRSYAAASPIKVDDLKRLKRQSALIPPGWSGTSGGGGSNASSFLEWCSFPDRPDWKLGWWDSEGEFARAALAVTKERYGRHEPSRVTEVKKGQVRRGDWLLEFELPTGKHLNWMHVDFVVGVDYSDLAFDENYPYQAVQANPLASYASRPPFAIDPAFRKAFARALKLKNEHEKIERRIALTPSKSFIERMRTMVLELGE
ncbi:hypothetical protein [Methylobacterium nigriterrae]|uniref:hypothetical protein n=1 Tax=Methylobacterium nigriterrae TaxID=3127512 RepID=UPI003013A451